MIGRSKKIWGGLFFLLILILTLKIQRLGFFSAPKRVLDFNQKTKLIDLTDDGWNFQLTTQARTVSDCLKENHIQLAKYDQINPSLDTLLYPRSRIQIKRAKQVKILVDHKEFSLHTIQKTVRQVLKENKIILSHLDKVIPELNAIVTDKLKIVVTRINIEKIVRKEPIKFKTVVKTSDKLGWRKQIIKQKGVLGSKEVQYQITYKNGKKIAQKVLNTKVIQSPKEQIELHGNHFKLGKYRRGQGSWYSQPTYLKEKYAPLVNNFAASTTLAKGSYAKVVNTANQKSIVVQISDYGPKDKSRIIDLDKKAFAKIASLGAGIINVKVAPILN